MASLRVAIGLLALILSPAEGVSQAVVEIETTLGVIVVDLEHAAAPETSRNFLRYVEAGLYEGGSFYRTVRLDNQSEDEVQIEVVQGGINRARREEAFDPIPMEGTATTGLRHLDGSLSMARAGPDSARGEFFICIGDQSELDEGGQRNPDRRGFAAFGRVVEGMEVVHRIHQADSNGQRLLEPVVIKAVRVRSEP